MKKLFSVLALSALLGMPVFSHAEDMADHHGLMITQAWSRVTTPGAKVGGGYLKIVNHSDSDDRLESVASNHSGKAEIHSMVMQDDVMIMRPLEDGLAIPAGETVYLAPGSLHLMFMQLRQPHVVGEPFEATLSFMHAGEKTVSFEVLSMRDSMAREAQSGDHAEGHKQ